MSPLDCFFSAFVCCLFLKLLLFSLKHVLNTLLTFEIYSQLVGSSNAMCSCFTSGCCQSELYPSHTQQSTLTTDVLLSKQTCFTHPQCDQIRRFFLTLGNFLRTLAAINLPKSSIFLGNFCKGVKIFNFFSEIIFGQLL